MNITRDVVSDLLPAYLSGEATADTRALVEELSARDPEIARLVASARDERSDSIMPSSPLPPDLERITVDRTRALLRCRSWLFALAIWCTVLPLTFVLGGGSTFFMLRDYPRSAWLWVVAANLWAAYFWTSWRLGLRR